MHAHICRDMHGKTYAMIRGRLPAGLATIVALALAIYFGQEFNSEGKAKLAWGGDMPRDLPKLQSGTLSKQLAICTKSTENLTFSSQYQGFTREDIQNVSIIISK